MSLGIDLATIDDRKSLSFDMGNEIAVGAACDHGHLDSGFAQSRQGFGEFQLATGVAPREDLDDLPLDTGASDSGATQFEFSPVEEDKTPAEETP